MIGNKIKTLRKQKGLTQLEFSKKTGISRSIIGMLETNKQGTSQSNLKIIADFFNVSVDYLLEENSSEFLNKENTIDIDNKKIKLLKEFNNLNEKGKDEAIKRIKELGELSKYRDTEFSSEIIPLAAHAKDGDFTQNEIKHDLDIMINDDLWK